jgi:hypothetical protein
MQRQEKAEAKTKDKRKKTNVIWVDICSQIPPRRGEMCIEKDIPSQPFTVF